MNEHAHAPEVKTGAPGATPHPEMRRVPPQDSAPDHANSRATAAGEPAHVFENRLSAYELGRLQALEQNKQEIERWLKQKFWLAAVVVALVGFFGADKLVTMLVKDEVEKALGKESEQIRKVNEKLLLTQAETRALQNKVETEWNALAGKMREIDQRILEITAKSQHIDSNSTELDKKMSSMDDKMREADRRGVKLTADLQELDNARRAFAAFIGEENAKNILQKIRNDYYRIRVATIDSRIKFAPSVKRHDFDRMPRILIGQIDLINASSQTHGEIMGQFYANGDPTLELGGDDDEETMVVSQQMLPFPPFERSLRDRPIDYLSQINRVAVRKNYRVPKESLLQAKQSLQKFFDSIESVEVDLIVNNVRCHTFHVAKANFAITVEDDADAEKVRVQAAITVDVKETEIRQQYDSQIDKMGKELQSRSN
jgi:hypothetical protein